MGEIQVHCTDLQPAQEGSTDVRERARSAVEAGDWAVAEELLRQALAHDPTWAEGHGNLGVCLAKPGNLSEAKRHLLAALRGAPDDCDAHHDLGVIYEGLGEYENALSCYKQVVLTRWDDHETFTRMARCAEELGRAHDSKVLYGQAIQLQPDALAPALALASLHLAEGDLPRADRVIRAALVYHPDETSLNYVLGLILEMQGQHRDALPLFRIVVQADDQHEEAFFHLGLCTRFAGYGWEAATFFARAINLNPEYLEAIYQLGELYRESGQLQKAVLAFEECLRRVDQSERRQRDWNQEVAETKRVPVLNALGLCHRAAGDGNQARRMWEESLGLNPSQEEVQSWLDEVSPLYRRTSLTID